MPKRRSDQLAEDIARTAGTIHDFALALHRVKMGAEADVNTELTRDECRALIFGFQALRNGGEDRG